MKGLEIQPNICPRSQSGPRINTEATQDNPRSPASMPWCERCLMMVLILWVTGLRSTRYVISQKQEIVIIVRILASILKLEISCTFSCVQICLTVFLGIQVIAAFILLQIAQHLVVLLPRKQPHNSQICCVCQGLLSVREKLRLYAFLCTHSQVQPFTWSL